MRVLIIDDSPLIQEALGKIVVTAMKFTVAGIADDGQQGVALCKSLLPEVVFLDIQMPVMNGIEALEKILEFDPHARVIMVSSVSDSSTVMKCIRLGAKTFIRKPENLFDSDVIEQIRHEVNLALELDH